MIPVPADRLLRHVRGLVAGSPTAPPDRDLLQAYRERGDQAAFAALVERHGPMVLGVCRAVLRHRHDAEDAFQATFLVLARQAASIRRPDSLASWLHGVAYRVARKAQAATARRQALEAKTAMFVAVDPADELSWGEVRAVLHAELAALPERYRAPLVLCYLEGLTQEEAAQRLGWTPTVLKGQLQRGRDRLRRRLVQRGLASASALGAMALTDHVLTVPLTAALRRAAVGVVETAPAAVAGLAYGVGGPFLLAKFWVPAAVLLAGAVLAGGVALLPQQREDSAPALAARPAAALPAMEGGAARTDWYGDPLPGGAVARLGMMRCNHPDGLNALHFSPDGRTIISDGGGHLCFWDAATGKLLRQCRRPNSSFADPTALTPDGKTMMFLALEGTRDTVQIWDLTRGQAVRSVPLGNFRSSSASYRFNALSRDGRLGAIHIAEAVDAQVRVFETATGKELYQLPRAKTEILTVTFAGNDRLVTADKSQVIDVWEARTGKRVRRFAHGAPVERLTASADGRWLITVGGHAPTPDRPPDKDVLRVWDLTTGMQKLSLAARPEARWSGSPQFTADSKLLFASSYHAGRYTLTVWDVQSGQQVRELTGAGGRVVAVSPDGRRLATADQGGFALWDLTAGRCLSYEDNRYALAPTVYLSPAGDRAVTLGYSSLSTWDATTGRRLDSSDLSPPRPDILPFQSVSPDGRYASGFTGDAAHRQLLIWDMAARRPLHTPAIPGSTSRVTSRFSPDSSLLATWQSEKKGGVARLWDARSGKEIRSFPETRVDGPSVRLFFTADGRTLLIGGWFRDLVGREVASGKELFFWQTPVRPNAGYPWRTLAVSPDGTLAAYLTGEGSDGKPAPNRITLCEAHTGKVLRRWSDSGHGSRYFEQMAFSPDGRLLASSDINTVHLWEVATASEVCIFAGHGGDIQSLAFSANGRRLATSSTDSTVLIWDWPQAVEVASPLIKTPTEKEIAAWWADLAGADARRAYAAVWRLAEAPAASVPLLRRHLRPMTDADRQAIRQHIKDLDAEAFAVREQAFRELETLGPVAAADLRRALEEKPSPEMRRRIERLLDSLSSRPLAGEPLRTLRALAVLEYAGTPEVRRLLSKLADGAPGGWLTQEAKAACERLTLPRTP